MEDTDRDIAENTGFWKDTLERQLLSIEQLERCLDDIPPEKRTPDKIENRLARLAVHHKFLTLWQAQRILTRRAGSLQFDKYQLIDTLGQGGMGRVFLAKDKRLNRQVAIKVLNPDRANHHRSLARFEREAQVGGQLQHENLVRIYDVGVYNHSPYLVMEYIEGPTVAHLIEKNGRIEVSQAAQIGRDVALGLQHLAEKRMVHRDVNPRNILIDMEGRAKLTDLGLAIFEEQQAQVTTEGSTVGTFDYISPEQARHSHGVDIRSDIYSLGCTIYHMVTGQVPFPAGSLPEKIYAHQAKDPQPLNELVSGVPREIIRIINKCMKKRPEERFNTARELADRLAVLISADTQFKTVDLLKSGSLELPSASQFELLGARGNRAEGSSPQDDAGREVSWDGVGPPSRSPDAEMHSDPDAIKIDLGNDSLELPFRPDSSRQSSDRSLTSELVLFKPSTIFALLAVFLVTILIYYQFPMGQNSSDAQRSSAQAGAAQKSVESQESTPGAGASGIVLKYADGTEQPCEDLAEAARRASGQTAEIHLPASEKPWVWPVSDSNPVVGPKLTVRSRGTELTRVMIDLSKSSKGLQVRSGASLVLSGLMIEITGAKPAVPVIHAYGNLDLEKCWLIHRDQQKVMPLAIHSSSGSLTIERSWIHGFATAVNLQVLPTSKVKILNSLLSNATATGGKAKKKPGSSAEVGLVVFEYPNANVDRFNVNIVQSSFIGDNTFEIRGQSITGSIGVTVSQCLFQSDFLFKTTTGSAITTLPVRWNGENNLFDLRDGFFQSQKGSESILKLADWAAKTVERNSLEHSVPLTNRFTQIPQPTDFLPKNDSDRLFGYR